MGFVFIRVNLKPEKSLNQFGPQRLQPPKQHCTVMGAGGLKPIMASLSNIMLLYAQPVRITLARDQIVMN